MGLVGEPVYVCMCVCVCVQLCGKQSKGERE